jgi:hypothetical protein
LNVSFLVSSGGRTHLKGAWRAASVSTATAKDFHRSSDWPHDSARCPETSGMRRARTTSDRGDYLGRTPGWGHKPRSADQLWPLRQSGVQAGPPAGSATAGSRHLHLGHARAHLAPVRVGSCSAWGQVSTAGRFIGRAQTSGNGVSPDPSVGPRCPWTGSRYGRQRLVPSGRPGSSSPVPYRVP